VRQVFQLPVEAYECTSFNEHYRYVMGQRSLLVSDGLSHRRKRRILVPGLNRQQTEKNTEAIIAAARLAIGNWPLNTPFSPRASLHELALSVILGLFFGTLDAPLPREILARFRSDIYQDFGTWGPWTRFSRYQVELSQRVGREVTRCRSEENAAEDGLFKRLLHALDDSGQPLEADEIADHLFTLVIAGVDPTALALEWSLYWLSVNHQALSSLVEELDSSPSALCQKTSDFPFLCATVQESLRMYPVVATPSGRKLTRAVKIGERDYHSGVTLLPCTYLVHHRADLYPEPKSFFPSRFLERSYSAYEYFPFGGGVRTCIGATLAPFELSLALSEIARSVHIEPAHESHVRPVRHGTLLAPSSGMKITVSPRPGVVPRRLSAS
jgi:cytochrome P450